MRRPLIQAHWALTPPGEKLAADIRKFEEVGTHPAANHLAIAEALVFHQTIGIERKAARLRYLRARWTDRLRASDARAAVYERRPGAGRRDRHGRSRGHSIRPSSPRICGTPAASSSPRSSTPSSKGLRVTPNLYTTLEEVDTFAAAMEKIADKGLPAAPSA